MIRTFIKEIMTTLSEMGPFPTQILRKLGIIKLAEKTVLIPAVLPSTPESIAEAYIDRSSIIISKRVRI